MPRFFISFAERRRVCSVSHFVQFVGVYLCHHVLYLRGHVGEEKGLVADFLAQAMVAGRGHVTAIKPTVL